MSISEITIRNAATLLVQGKLVAFPTETVYGLGADARNSEAVAKIYTAKGRPANNPLIVHIHSIEQIERYADTSLSWNPTLVKEWISKLAPLWPGPLSVVLPRGRAIAENVSAGGSSVALRIPNHPIALDLLKAFDGPIAAPSANPSNYVSPTTAQHVRDGLGERVDFVIDGGPCAVGLESTVLSLLQKTPKILRPGAITVEMLEALLGHSVEGPSPHKSSEVSALPSPGLLAKHYSPRTKVVLRSTLSDVSQLPPRVGVLLFSSWKPPFPTTKTIVLSACGDFEEIAARLFGALRELDEAGLDLIISDECEPVGLGEAIMDRLTRASHV
jgi:L-threonylcarbamoyladenylate synthase